MPCISWTMTTQLDSRSTYYIFYIRNLSPEENCKVLKPENKCFPTVKGFISPLTLGEVW